MSPFRPQSTFCPQVTNPSINTFCRLVEREVLDTFGSPRSYTDNLSKEEKKALRELMDDDKDITIKPADKGGAIVIQDTENYMKDILAQLSNSVYYKKLQTDPTLAFQENIVSYLEYALSKEWITKLEFDFLCCKNPIIPVFYTLPKIHKDLNNPPGRPIVSQIGSLLSPLSEYVDFFIKEKVQTLPAFLKDSTDFINKISGLSGLTDDSYLLTLDVSSLYTNIPHEEGLEALHFYLRNREDTEKPPTEFLIQLATFVMKLNYFTFNKTFYQQMSGTSMGTICAPNYANLYMGHFEENYIFNTDKNVFAENIILYYRYIDDIFCIFRGNQEQLMGFADLINNFKTNLKFSLEYSKDQVSFLDMWVQKRDGHLTTTLYKKPTDKNTLLLATSAHPTPLKKGLPKSQFFRLRRVCHTTEDFINKADEMKFKFRQRGYTPQWINEAYEAALSKSRESLLQKNKRQGKKNLNNI